MIGEQGLLVLFPVHGVIFDLVRASSTYNGVMYITADMSMAWTELDRDLKQRQSDCYTSLLHREENFYSSIHSSCSRRSYRSVVHCIERRGVEGQVKSTETISMTVLYSALWLFMLLSSDCIATCGHVHSSILLYT